MMKFDDGGVGFERNVENPKKPPYIRENGAWNQDWTLKMTFIPAKNPKIVMFAEMFTMGLLQPTHNQQNIVMFAMGS